MDFEWAEVGQRIRARRLAQEKTQQQLATAAGLTQNAIFRLEAGNTNPQLSTLKVVAQALGTNARELVCGVEDADPRLGDRLVLVRRILESGDDAAIRAMDYGLENAQTVLERTSRFWEKAPQYMRLGGRTYRRSVTEGTMSLKEDRVPSTSESQAAAAPAPPRRPPRIPQKLKKEIQEVTGYRLDEAPHLPVGNAITIALPDSNRQKEQHVHVNPNAARADSERLRR